MAVKESNGKSPTSSSHETIPPLTTNFSQTKFPFLTHEEECLLKTALAFVVVKQRCKKKKKSGGQFRKAKVAQRKNPLRGNSRGLLDRLFVQSSPPNRSSLLLLSHHQHLDRIFQAALNMVILQQCHQNDDSSTQQDSAGGSLLQGTCSHLAAQLQVWLQEDDAPIEAMREEEEAEGGGGGGTRPRRHSKRRSIEECSRWIRHSLLTSSYHATFRVYHHLLAFSDGQLTGVILKVLIALLQEAYHDRFLVALPNKKSRTASQTAKVGTFVDCTNDGGGSIDRLSVLWLRLTNRCVQQLNPSDVHLILRNSSPGLADLLLPFAVSTNSTKSTSLIQIYWESSTASLSTAASADTGLSQHSSHRMSNQPAPARLLGTGAKMLLRLGLHRLLYCNNSRMPQTFAPHDNDGSTEMNH